jgi:hypothetical protein
MDISYLVKKAYLPKKPLSIHINLNITLEEKKNKERSCQIYYANNIQKRRSLHACFTNSKATLQFENLLGRILRLPNLCSAKVHHKIWGAQQN